MANAKKKSSTKTAPAGGVSASPILGPPVAVSRPAVMGPAPAPSPNMKAGVINQAAPIPQNNPMGPLPAPAPITTPQLASLASVPTAGKRIQSTIDTPAAPAAGGVSADPIMGPPASSGIPPRPASDPPATPASSSPSPATPASGPRLNADIVAIAKRTINLATMPQNILLGAYEYVRRLKASRFAAPQAALLKRARSLLADEIQRRRIGAAAAFSPWTDQNTLLPAGKSPASSPADAAAAGADPAIGPAFWLMAGLGALVLWRR